MLNLLEAYGGTTFYFGENTGIVNRFVDSTVTPGITYYYAVCAFDRGDGTPDIFPEENSKFIFRSNTGEVILDDNTALLLREEDLQDIQMLFLMISKNRIPSLERVILLLR